MRTRLYPTILALLVIPLLTLACASPAAPTAGPATPAKPPEASKPAGEVSKAPEAAKPAPPIKVGYLASFTGSFAQNGIDMRDGFALYLDEKGGSLAGRKIELISEDDETSAQVGLTKAKKLVERDNVQMLAGIVSSAVAYAVADYVIAQKVPFLINNAGSDDLTKERFSPYIFRNSFSNSQMGYPLGEWAYKKGYRKAVIVASDMSAGYEEIGGFAKTFTEAGGQIIQEMYPALGTADPSPFVTAIKPEADVVVAFQNAAEAVRFVKAYEQYGLKGRIPLMGVMGFTNEYSLVQQGDSALGIVNSIIWSAALDLPANKSFMAAFQKKYNRQVSYGQAVGYEGAMMLDKALQAIDGKIEDKEAFIKALEKVELRDSPRGPVKFDKYHNGVIDVYISEVKNVDGKLVNSIIETYKDVSQFWKWTPDEVMKWPSYTDLKGKWAK